jgi:hypothetical protein
LITDNQNQNVWYLHNSGSPLGPMTLGSLKERLWSMAEWETAHVWCEGYPAWVLAGDEEQLKRKVPPPLTKAAFRVGTRVHALDAASRLDVSPALLLQFHHTHNA